MKKVALLVSDSGLWGLWSYWALKKVNLAFEPVLAEEIDEAFGKRYSALFVPGGWSSNKLSALGERGKKIIQAFVENGGIYIGICGGASLAGEEGLSLIRIKRQKERVPSYSGPFLAKVWEKHPLFRGLRKYVFYLWFPPNLKIEDDEAQILATFFKALPEGYTSDLSLMDHQDKLDEWERIYQIKLNPERMKNAPLLILKEKGKGKILLSLIHFDTPQDQKGLIFLKNLGSLWGLPNHTKLEGKGNKSPKFAQFSKDQINLMQYLTSLYRATQEVIALGVRNFLFYHRKSYFWQWRRGIKGLEIQNFYFLLRELLKLLSQKALPSYEALWELCPKEEEFQTVLEALKSEYLRFRLNYKPDPEEDEAKKNEIFGEHLKSYGGLYKKVLNQLEHLLCIVWRA